MKYKRVCFEDNEISVIALRLDMYRTIPKLCDVMAYKVLLFSLIVLEFTKISAHFLLIIRNTSELNPKKVIV